MKRTALFALMMTLLFSGCAGQRQDENEWRSWQESLARAEEIACTGEITARIEEEQVTFTAEIRRAAGETALTVTAPEAIRGVTARTRDSVHVLNLVEGEEAVVESPDGRFEPFVVHYAETFIIPACVEAYTIRPCGLSEGKTCMTIRASIRFNA